MSQYPQQGYPQQGYPQQGHPQAGYGAPAGHSPYGHGSPAHVQTPQHSYNQDKPQGHYQQPMQQHQPQATQGMTIGGGGNRNAKNMPMDADGREWSNGLFDCCDDAGTCLLAWCCPCVVYSQVKNRVEYLNRNNKPDPEVGGGFCTGSCWAHCCLTSCCGLGWVLQISSRSTIRSRYNVKGGGCGDCMTAFCCTPCELTQEHRELELEEQSFAGYKA